MSNFDQKRLEKAGDGTKNFVTSVALTTTFADITGGSYFIDTANWDEMTIYMYYDAITAGHVVTTRVDFSATQDSADFNPEADEVVTAGLAVQLPKLRAYTTLTNSEEAVPVMSVPVADRWARIMAKASAGTTSTLRVQIILSKVGQ